MRNKSKIRTRKSALAASAPRVFPIVGVGASAGGLEAFTLLLKNLPTNTGMAMVLVQHLDPQHESALTSILARITKIPIAEVTNNLRVEPNHIYVIPPNTNMSIVKGVLKLEARVADRTANYSINYFLKSLALDQNSRAIGVILSGSATDGTIGLEAIKEEGGITFAQDDSAKYESMPRSAISTGCVDFVLSPEKIAAELARLASHPYVLNAYSQAVTKLNSRTEMKIAQSTTSDSAPTVPSKDAQKKGARPSAVMEESVGEHTFFSDVSYQKLIQLLSHHSDVDFSLYKPSTIQRRMARRVVLNKLESFGSYVHFLRGNMKELDSLYSDVLINVTNFFRNPEVFETLKRTVFPQLYQKNADDPMRVWVVGCSTGQEAYSIAMAFLEISENAGPRQKMQVFATDLNEASLEKARQGLYSRALVADISPKRLSRYFTEEAGGYRVSKTLREMCVFAKHNLINDPPFSRMDLISCRNVLIYLDHSIHQKVLPIFHYALKPTGYLLLGSSESASQFTNLFESIDKKQRIFIRKLGSTSARDLQYPIKNTGTTKTLAVLRKEEPKTTVPSELNAQREADRITINLFAPPGVLINSEMKILQFRGDTQNYLVPPKGKADFDLLKMSREGMMLPLRETINKATKENKTIHRTVDLGRAIGPVTIEVIPLINLKERCYLVLFKRVQLKSHGQGRAEVLSTNEGRAQADIENQDSRENKKRASIRIKELERELAEARDFAQSVEERYETAHYDLQASGEEIQSANEELQSMNEELETSKEEIESNNEELTTVNEEMVNRNSELSSLNSDLNNFHLSVNMAFVLLARDLTIRRFSSQAMKVFNLLDTDIGRPIGNIKHNLICQDLEQLLAEVVQTVSVRECEVRDKDGHWLSLRVRPYMTQDNMIDGAVLVLVDIDELKKTEEARRVSEIRYRRLFEAARDGVILMNPNTRKITEVNPFLLEFIGRTQEELVGKELFELGLIKDEQENKDMFKLLKEKGFVRYDDLPITTKSGGVRQVEFVSNLYRENGHEVIQCNVRDITERKRTQDALGFLSDASEVLFSSLEYEKTLTALTALAVPKLADWAFIDLVQNGKVVRLAVAHIKTATNELVNKIMKFPFDKSSLDQLPGHVFESGKSLLLRQFTEETMLRRISQSTEHTKLIQEIDPKSMMLIPLIARKSIIGVLTMVVCGSRRYGSKDLALAEELARRASIAIDNARLFKDSEDAANKLLEADKAKDEFMAMLAHELRNPLAPILSASEIIRMSKSNNAAIDKAQGVISRQTKHMIGMIDDLLDTSRLQQRKVTLNKVNLDLTSLVMSAKDACQPAIEAHHHAVTMDLSNDPPLYVNADPARLEQVVTNLLVNAIKYTPPHGAIHISSKREDNMAVIRIQDNGLGIEQHMLEHIFNPFAQVNASLERKGGLGLGLKLVKELVEMLGGTVQAKSEGLGIGSEFIVRLPVVKGSKSEILPLLKEKIAPTGKRILLVDDNTDVLETMSMLLSLEGHSVKVADDGKKGLDMALGERFDVAIVDIGLPILNGYEVAKGFRAQSNGADTILIALTGYGQEKDRQRALDAGFDAHLTKPVDTEKLAKLFSRPPVVT